jgi:8-oxo-dGTP diphosphatase
MASKLIPNLSTDCVIFDYSTGKLRVLLVQRDIPGGSEENRFDLKLPGGLIYKDELLKDAAARTLKELTGLEQIHLEQFDVLDSLERLDQADRLWLEKTSGLTIDRVVSIAFYGIVSEEQNATLLPNSRWVEMEHTRKLPFDHTDIINRALVVVRNKLRKEGLLFSLLPDKFTISQLQNILQIFYDDDLDSRNFRKKIKKFDYIVPLSEKQHNVAHKPAQLFRFDYEMFLKFNNYRITI